MGVVLLPIEFFSDPKDIGKDEDRWIRFSVANVDDEKVKLVCERLKRCGEVLGWRMAT